jgi:hypothetical protein
MRVQNRDREKVTYGHVHVCVFIIGGKAARRHGRVLALYEIATAGVTLEILQHAVGRGLGMAEFFTWYLE